MEKDSPERYSYLGLALSSLQHLDDRERRKEKDVKSRSTCGRGRQQRGRLIDWDRGRLLAAASAKQELGVLEIFPSKGRKEARCSSNRTCPSPPPNVYTACWTHFEVKRFCC